VCHEEAKSLFLQTAFLFIHKETLDFSYERDIEATNDVSGLITFLYRFRSRSPASTFLGRPNTETASSNCRRGNVLFHVFVCSSVRTVKLQ
jgi:hypothetical protein